MWLSMTRRILLPVATAFVVGVCCYAPLRADLGPPNARDLVEKSGVSAGFFVHLGAQDARLAQALKTKPSIQVHARTTSAKTAGQIRADLVAAGVNGAGTL